MPYFRVKWLTTGTSPSLAQEASRPYYGAWVDIPQLVYRRLGSSMLDLPETLHVGDRAVVFSLRVLYWFSNMIANALSLVN